MRKEMYKNLIAILLLSLVFVGCSKNEPIYTSKEYKNIDKDYVLNAAKKVMLLSDNNFNIHSNSHDIKAVRVIPKYRAFDVDLEINTIYLEVEMDKNTTIAKLSINKKYKYFNNNKEKIIKGKVHNLIWNRIDYILGINNKWQGCFDNINAINYDGILCNTLYNQNNNATKKDIIKFNDNSNEITYVKSNNTELKKIDLNEIKNIKLPNVNYNKKDIKLKKIKLEDMNIKLPIINTTNKIDNNIGIQEIDLEQ